LGFQKKSACGEEIHAHSKLAASEQGKQEKENESRGEVRKGKKNTVTEQKMRNQKKKKIGGSPI